MDVKVRITWALGLAKKIEGSQLSFNLTHMFQGEVVQQRIPGMLYADDIALLADNESDIQWFINISGQEATDLELNFSTEESGVMVFSGTCTDSVSIQHGELSRVKEYEYLRVWINEGDNYLKLTRSNLKEH